MEAIQIQNFIRKKIVRQISFVNFQKYLRIGNMLPLKREGRFHKLPSHSVQIIDKQIAPEVPFTQKAISHQEHYNFSNKAELAALLETKVVISDACYFKALNDKYYLHNLLCSKGTPFLEIQLKNTSGHRSIKLAARTSELAENIQTEKILLGFAKSMAKWGTSGFAKVDEQTHIRRLEACANCPLLSSVPNMFLYRLMEKKSESSGVCSACGCVVSKKALLATDTCPEAGSKYPMLNKWGEKRIC